MSVVMKDEAYQLLDSGARRFGVVKGGSSPRIVVNLHGSFISSVIGTDTVFSVELDSCPKLDAVYEWRYLCVADKVRKLKSFREDNNDNPLDYFKLVWEAPVEVEELTMSELIQRLGYPVKIVER